MLEERDLSRSADGNGGCSEHVAELEKHCRGAAVRIPVGPEIVHLIPAGLPSGIFFGPGRLTIDYGNVEKLLRQLYEVAQAAVNDFDQFSELAMPTTSRTANGADRHRPGQNKRVSKKDWGGGQVPVLCHPTMRLSFPSLKMACKKPRRPNMRTQRLQSNSRWLLS